MNFENLTKMPIEELRVLAAKHGIKAHHKAKPETIAKQIIEAATEPKKTEMNHPAQEAKPASTMNTPEQVKEACAKFLVMEGFEVSFKDDTWHFKRLGAEDCGHMSVPLRIIRMKAETVSRGARKPSMVQIDGERILGV